MAPFQGQHGLMCMYCAQDWGLAENLAVSDIACRFEEKVDAFQQRVIGFCKKNSYCLHQIGNADEMPGVLVCFPVILSTLRQNLW